jgi:cytochrome c
MRIALSRPAYFRIRANKLSCQTCHQGHAAFNASFAKPYPHPVAMAQERAGLAKIDADEMVQICLVVPMAAKPLPWNSKELAGLTTYVKHVQKGFKPSAAGAAKPGAANNPCAATNPCAAKKP